MPWQKLPNPSPVELAHWRVVKRSKFLTDESLGPGVIEFFQMYRMNAVTGGFRVMFGLASFRGALARLGLAAAQISLERRRQSLRARLSPRRAWSGGAAS